ncbi:gp53-like domain-containing protein [Escherichia coli]|uniref:gp53-like domain-containing protein n=1 Tax=Escherichia coli TaxID=562 RepID=UPI0021CA1604|nr:hypothetical protein [Escherichia coli]MCQ6539901.1 hypothetical protein [Escherichia coli]
MALDRSNRYPGRFENPTSASPQGAFKNRTSPTAQDGSYFEADWANDWDGFFGRLLTLAGVSPNGNVDTASSSQYYDALKSLFLQRTDPFGDINSDGTVETALANLGLGTAAKRNADARLINGIPDMSSFRGDMIGNGYIKIPIIGASGGPQTFILQWGVHSTSPGSNAAYNLNIAFPTSLLWASGGRGAPGSNAPMNVGPEGAQQIRIQNYAPGGVNENCFWIAIGY